MPLLPWPEILVTAVDPSRDPVYVAVVVRLGELKGFLERLRSPHPLDLEIVRCTRPERGSDAATPTAKCLQRWQEETAARLTGGDPRNIVVWRDARFNASTGGAPAGSTSLQDFLEPRSCFFSIDDFRTSRLCPACHHPMVEVQVNGEVKRNLRRCIYQPCPRDVWQSNVAAACNMLVVFARWLFNEPKPWPFIRGNQLPDDQQRQQQQQQQ